MYFFYKIISRVAKFFSNALLVIAIPISIILAALFGIYFWLEPFLKSLNLWSYVNDALIASNSFDAFNTTRWITLALMILIIVCWIIFITAWIIKKINYKRIANIDIARNKEFRNQDINEYQEKLEKYRYRD